MTWYLGEMLKSTTHFGGHELVYFKRHGDVVIIFNSVQEYEVVTAEDAPNLINYRSLQNGPTRTSRYTDLVERDWQIIAQRAHCTLESGQADMGYTGMVFEGQAVTNWRILPEAARAELTLEHVTRVEVRLETWQCLMVDHRMDTLPRVGWYYAYMLQDAFPFRLGQVVYVSFADPQHQNIRIFDGVADALVVPVTSVSLFIHLKCRPVKLNQRPGQEPWQAYDDRRIVVNALLYEQVLP